MFATLQAVKELDGSFRSVTQDNDLQVVVNGVNAKVEDFLDRHLIIDDYVDSFDVFPTSSVTYKLKGFPVSSVSSVTLDDNELSASEYRINYATGRVQLLVPIPVGVSQLSVSYTGGMASDVDALRTDNPSCVYNTCIQVLFEFKRKGKIAHSSISIKDGGDESLLKYGLLTEVRRALSKYRRKRLVG